MLSRLTFILLLVAAATCDAAGALAPDLPAQWRTQLDAAAAQLEVVDLGDEKLRDIRAELDGIRAKSTQYADEIQPNLKAVKIEFEALGPPPPAEGGAAEPTEVVKQRTEISARMQAVEGRIREAELVETRAALLLSDISEIRRTRFSQRLFSRGPSPFSFDVWLQAVPQIIAASAVGRQAVSNVFTADPVKVQVRESALAIAIAAIVAVLFAWPLHAWLLRRFGRDPAIPEPGFMHAMRAMLVVGAVRALLPTAAAALVYVVAINTALATPAAQGIAKALLLGFVFFVWVVAFFRASLAPRHSAWRVLPVPDNFARGMWRFVILLALVYALDIVLSEVFTIYGARLEIRILRDYLVALVVILLLAALLLRQDMWRPSAPPSAEPSWRSARMLAAITLMLFPFIGAAGYVALMKYVATQALLTGGMVLLFLILHRLGRESIRQLASGNNWVANRIRDYLHFGPESTRRLEFWAGFTYDITLFAGGLVGGLFIWGANREDLESWLYQAIFGFQIGRIHIALIDIGIAAAVVATLVIATRVLQRTLAEQVLPQTRLDIGIRESIRQATGYIGMVIALLAGIAALGLDLSSFALVASALTVGLGFGLQNVVSNFVSGLILLVERPIKVGDWIVVGDQQGYVRQIRVRATEIQTFDRASVFVPNSQLISGMVTNWTHADRLARVIIPIGVAYGSDTQLVRNTLQEIASAHPLVLKDPPATAVFRGFGDSSLNFELRCVIEDVEKTVSVTSDLCFAVDEAFRKANIEIPFPQRDVYLRKASGESFEPSHHGPGENSQQE